MRFGLLLALALTAGTALGADVRFELTLKDGKVSFLSGEPIRLQLSFTSATPFSSVNATVTEPPSPIDTVILEPAAGVYPWLELQARGHRYSPDYGALADLVPDKPLLIPITLNDLYRFDRAGHYSVYVVTRRSANKELTSNIVQFDVMPFPELDEAKRAASLEQAIRNSANQRAAQTLADELDYLGGDAATAAKLSLLLRPKEFCPFAVDLNRGLWIARNRRMVVAALEKAIVDPAQRNGSGSGMFNTLVALKQSMDDSPAEDAVIAADYLHRIALTIPGRTGESRIDAARTVLTEMARVGQTNGPDFQMARETLIAHFDDINEYNVEWLLNPNGYGKYLQDTRLLPALYRILDTKADPIFTGNRAAALSELAAIDPQWLPKYIVNEACADYPVMMQTIRGITSEQTLPEADGCLREKLRRETSKGGDTRKLASTMEYIARFADPALLPDVQAAYAADAENWDQNARGAALTYLMRWDARNSRSLIDKMMPGNDPFTGDMVFSLLNAAYIPARGLREVFRDQIRTAPAKYATSSAYALSRIGEPDDRAFLRGELARLRLARGAAFSADDGNLEAELVTAIIHGDQWKSTNEEAAALENSCVSAECKQRFPHR